MLVTCIEDITCSVFIWISCPKIKFLSIIHSLNAMICRNMSPIGALLVMPFTFRWTISQNLGAINMNLICPNPKCKRIGCECIGRPDTAIEKGTKLICNRRMLVIRYIAVNSRYIWQAWHCCRWRRRLCRCWSSC